MFSAKIKRLMASLGEKEKRFVSCKRQSAVLCGTTLVVAAATSSQASPDFPSNAGQDNGCQPAPLTCILSAGSSWVIFLLPWTSCLAPNGRFSGMSGWTSTFPNQHCLMFCYGPYYTLSRKFVNKFFLESSIRGHRYILRKVPDGQRMHTT